jgi:hypothetical protein
MNKWDMLTIKGAIDTSHTFPLNIFFSGDSSSSSSSVFSFFLFFLAVRGKHSKWGEFSLL